MCSTPAFAEAGAGAKADPVDRHIDDARHVGVEWRVTVGFEEADEGAE